MLRLLTGFACVLGAGVWTEILVWSNPDATDRRLWLDHPLQLVGAAALAFLGAVFVVSNFPKEGRK